MKGRLLTVLFCALLSQSGWCGMPVLDKSDEMVRNSVCNAQGESNFFSYFDLAAEPTSASSGIAFPFCSPNAIQVGFTAGNGANRIVVARLYATTRVEPADGFGYSVNSASFSDAANSSTGTGNVVIYNGSGNMLTIIGLIASTAYAFDVYEYNGTNETANYLNSTYLAGGKSTISAEPTAQASGINFTNLSSSGFTVNWTKGIGADNTLLVIRASSPVDAIPVDGNSYAASVGNVFGTGSDIGAGSGNYVVYRGSLSSIAVAVLAAGTTYHVALFSYNGASGSGLENYLTGIPATASQGLPIPTYYSQSSGDPSILGNWISSRTGGGSSPTSLTATAANFVIQSGYTMTTSSSFSIGSAGAKLQVENGGVLNAVHGITVNAGTIFQVDNGGTYIHNNTDTPATTIFAGTESFAPSSNVRIDNWINNTTSIKNGVTLPFGNLELNLTGNSVTWQNSLEGTVYLCAGNFKITSLGTGSFKCSTTAAFDITIGGDLIMSGSPSSSLDFASNNGASVARNVYIGGNYTQTGGTVVCSGTSNPVNIFFTGLNKSFVQSGGNITFTNINWYISSGASLTLYNSLPIANNRSLNIDGTFNCGAISVFGSGRAYVNSGGTIKLGSASSSGAMAGNITASGGLTLNAGSMVEYNGSGAQSIAARTFFGLTINNSNGVKLLGDVTVNDNLVMSSGNLSLNGQSLTANAAITGTGKLVGSAGSSLVIAGAAGTLNFDQSTAGARTLKNLTLAASASATLGTALELASGTAPGTLLVNSGATLNTTGLLTIKSDNNGTARVGISSGTIAGNVTVERHIPNNGFRSWRLLSVPTYGSQTINGAWQEGNIPMGNNTPGFGTQITGSSTALGFDDLSPYPSMLTFNGTNFAGIPNTGIPISNSKAYFIYLRGDRTAGVSVSTSANSATTLRTTGSIYQGTQNTSNIPANSYSLIGNPFASTIDFTGITRTGGVKDAFYIWDSKINSGTSLGVYQTFSGTNAYLSPLPNGSFNQGQPNTSIQSGQAFFVENGPTTGSVSIPESSKVVSSASTGFKLPGELVKIDSRLYSLTAADTTMADANVLVFDTAYSNAVDVEDASKFSNTGENLGIVRHSETLVIEGRKPVITTDTLFYKIWNMQAHAYQLEFVPQNLGSQNLSARLEDGYLHTSTAVDLSVVSRVNFVVNTSPASYASYRFRLVFGPSLLVPLSFQSIGAIRMASNAQVIWKVGNETNINRYEVERSTDGSKFDGVGSVTANAASAYGFTDLNVPSSNLFYRIRSVGVGADVKYSSVVNLAVESSKSSFAVVPNPVEGDVMNIQFVNQAKGMYHLKLVNGVGQQVLSARVSHPGGVVSHAISLPYGLARGIYQLEVVAPDKTTNIQKGVVLSKY